MQRFTLTLREVDELVRENRYKVDEKSSFISRCIDGRYENSPDLPALAIAGADAGELGILLATATEFGFDIDPKKAFEVVSNIVGGTENLRVHTDNHAKGKLMGGCGHVKHMTTDYEMYNLKEEQAKAIQDLFAQAVKQGAQEVALQGEHEEGAVLIVNGEWGILPRFTVATHGGQKAVQVFVFHQTLVDRRHKALAKALVEEGAVKLFDDLDEEYLYQVISATTETHLLETASRLAKGLLIYAVSFKDDGSFEISSQ